ncbi:O-antigen ligase [Pelagibius sp.]|uniref:O-antigen ligase family protein n=1 Tax=Pelagibius sp. TaxID=1931238 RepID=UPI002632CE5E|nr:O-antigen ligase family protein [Pelagibius sp.]
MASSDLEPGKTFTTAKKIYGALTHSEVVKAAHILVLCTAFVLETRGHRVLFYVVALPIFILSLRELNLRSLGHASIAKLAFAYVAYVLVSGLWTEGLIWTDMANLLRLALLVSVFFAITALLAAGSESFEKRLFVCFALSASLTLLVVFAVRIFSGEPDLWRLTGFGLASHPIIGATLYGSVVLIAAFCLLPQARGMGERLLWVGVIGLGLCFMMLTASRGPLIALICALLITTLIADRRIAMIVFGLCTVGLLGGVLLELKPIVYLYERAPSGHFEIWQQALQAIAEHPWFGHGSLAEGGFAGKHGPSRSAHNLLLANQFYGGIPATLLLVALLGVAALWAYRAALKGKPIYLVLLVFGFVASLFDSRSLVQNLGREWVTLWLPFGLLAARELRDRDSRGGSVEP